MARKIIQIELEAVRNVAKLQCTKGEAAAALGIKPKKFTQILAEFPEVQEAWDQGRELGKLSLRRKQFRLAAMNGSMAIHLGKNYLEQKDVTVNEIKDGGPSDIDMSQLTADERTKLRTLLIKSSKPGKPA